MINVTILRDALYNLTARSGASADYCQGLIVGVVAALMAETGRPYAAIIREVRENLPEGFRADYLPEAFSADLNG